jgi:hypothetical protein
MDHIWVGVGHTKNKQRMKLNGFQYISRLYALSPSYDLIARSGLFCLGFPTPQEEEGEEYINDGGSDVNSSIGASRISRMTISNTTAVDTSSAVPHGRLMRHNEDDHHHRRLIEQAKTSKFMLKQTTYDCPRIEFVSGMSEHVDDPDMAVLTYGINDCISRIVSVPKDQLGRRLFGNMG